MTKLRTAVLVCAIAALSLADARAQQLTGPPAAESYAPHSGQDGQDAPWVPTPQILVNRMLAIAEVTKDDYVVDLGSGDGRTVVTAALWGARAHGIELNPDLVALSARLAAAEGVSDRATFEQADIFKADFSAATVVTIFMLGDINIRLRPTLLDMKPGTRVVSNTFGMDDWEPDETSTASGGCGSFCRAMKWIVPAKVGGDWRLNGRRLRLDQRFQMLTGSIEQDGAPLPISDARMSGSRIAFTAGGRRYSGGVAGSVMSGVVEGGEAWRAERLAD